MNHRLNALGASLCIQVVRKEITKEEAQGQLFLHFPQKCKIGAHGLCTIHGQPMIECKQLALKG